MHTQYPCRYTGVDTVHDTLVYIVVYGPLYTYVHQCTVYTNVRALYIVHCTLYSVLLLCVQCTVYGVLCVQCTVSQCVQCTVNYVYSVQCVQCTVYTVQSPLYTPLFLNVEIDSAGTKGPG